MLGRTIVAIKCSTFHDYKIAGAENLVIFRSVQLNPPDSIVVKMLFLYKYFRNVTTCAC